MKRLLPLTFLAVAMATVAGAQSMLAPIQFAERPGSQEFSGRMIARPLQVNALAALGIRGNEAQTMRAEAADLVLPATIKYIPETDEYILRVPKGWNESRMASYLIASGRFQYVEPDWTVYPIAIPNDPQYGSQWHLPKVNLPAAWDHFRGGTAVTIAITDTGVRLDHEDLASRLVSGANSATGTVVTQANGGAVNDINGHGTHCAGIAGAAGNNALGVSGANWNINIMPVRVTNSTGGSSSITALTAGARWAADNGARVVSTSYSGVDSAAVGTTGTYIKNTRNGVYCWAAGNDNVARVTDHVDVTVVGASTQTDTKASFSAFGVPLDVFAPGVNIVSTYNSSATSYATLSGTSMACPFAAGVAALITGSNPTLTAQEVETILYTTCFDLTAAPGGPGNDGYWGWGRIDAYAALRLAYATKPFAPATYTLVKGSLQSGTVSSLAKSDDAKLVVAKGTNDQDVIIEFESQTTNLQVGRLDFVIESSTSLIKATQEVELFDYAANAWVLVNSRTISSVDGSATFTPANPSRFVSPTTRSMRARVKYPLGWSTARNVSLSIDQIGWFTQP